MGLREHAATDKARPYLMSRLSLDEVRRKILIAMVSDEELFEALVLKGGNALALVHGLIERATLDMDFSIASQFPDLDEAKTRIFRALHEEFIKADYVVFDERFLPKPSTRGENQPEWWGGYLVEFKLVRRETFELHKNDLDALRRNAELLGPQQKRTYSIDISKNEYCAGKIKGKLDQYTVYVYSLEMIAIEKLRAICQQLPQYQLTRNKTPRARDFYDVHEVVTRTDVDLFTEGNAQLFHEIFRAKGVPLELMLEIRNSKDFHALDWPSVAASMSVKREEFEYYFAYVCELVAKLYAVWKK
jgi:predicted nucleotidyltransferase component of viral defense system